MDLTRIVSGMDLMVVVEEDVKGEEKEMETEVVEEEGVKDPLEELEELEELVVLALTDQIPTVSGMFKCLSIIFLVVRRSDMISSHESGKQLIFKNH